MTEEQVTVKKILSAESPLSEWGIKLHYGFGANYGRTFVIDDTAEQTKYLCAVLSSTLARWFVRQVSPIACTKSLRLEEMPIPKISLAEQRPFIALVDEIIAAKAANPGADTWYKELELNDLVYDLYEITGEEEDVIERSLGLIPTTEKEEDAILVKVMEEELMSGEGFVSEEEIMAALRSPNEG